MQIVISGTHASGKSTLISDFVMRHAEFEQLPDPFELIDEIWDQPGVAMFTAQLRIAASRLIPEGQRPAHLLRIAERGPIDFLAYLVALEEIGRANVNDALFSSARSSTIAAMSCVDLLVVLPLTADDPFEPGVEEDRELRSAMNDALLDLVDDPELIGDRTTAVEIFGDPDQRCSSLQSFVSEWRTAHA